MNPKIIPLAHFMIQCNEGFRAEKYKDTNGYWTIGFGHNLDASGKRLETVLLWEAEELFTEDFQHHRQDAEKIEEYHSLDDIRKLVLIDMVYQMGLGRVLKFKQTLKWIGLKQYDAAAIELLDSKYAKTDSPNRAQRNARLLRSGFLFDIPLLDINGLTAVQNQRKKYKINQLFLG